MSGIIWIASYPKSGNTWVRFLLANYLLGTSEGVPVDRLWFGHSAAQRWVFDEWAGIETSDLVPDEVDECRADVYRAIAARSSARVFLKTHERWRRTSRGTAIFPVDVSSAVIYIVRHPFDVAISLAHHFDVSVDEAVRHMSDEDLVLSGSEHGIHQQLPQAVGSWSTNSRSWLDEAQLPVLLVRYEDLLRDTAQQLTKIVQGLGIPFDALRIGTAVAQSSFTRLQREEASKGFHERVSRSTPFFRRGTVGEGFDVLGADQRARLGRDQRQMMERLGYSDDTPTT